MVFVRRYLEVLIKYPELCGDDYLMRTSRTDDMGRVLFNASNIQVGGGVQVAVSVLGEWIERCGSLPLNIEIWASSVVDSNLRRAGYDANSLPNYRVADNPGWRGLISKDYWGLGKFRRVFTLFGPLYSVVRPIESIVGFAQAQIIYPDSEYIRRIGWRRRLLRSLKSRAQRGLFRRSDSLVVELDHVATAISEQGWFPDEKIHIVRNCLNNVFLDIRRWQVLPRSIDFVGIRIGYLGRNYPHKNTQILPAICQALADRHGLRVKFYVTFSDDEWSALSGDFKSWVENVGELSVAQCPAFYQAMDAIIFPSLLECFSATPLEALAMAKPLFASDRPFVRDVCDDFAFYFDPLDALDAADRIAAFFTGGDLDAGRGAAGREHALSYSSAYCRAEKVLSLLLGSEFN